MNNQEGCTDEMLAAGGNVAREREVMFRTYGDLEAVYLAMRAKAPPREQEQGR